MSMSPKGDEKISEHVLEYHRERQRLRLHSALLKLFSESGISQACLARRVAKKPEQVSRWLRSPTNLTLDTLSDLLYALDGAELVADVRRPGQIPPRNFKGSDFRSTAQAAFPSPSPSSPKPVFQVKNVA